MCVHAHVETMAILHTVFRLLCEFSVEKNSRLTIGRLVTYHFSTSVDHNHDIVPTADTFVSSSVPTRQQTISSLQLTARPNHRNHPLLHDSMLTYLITDL